MTNASTLTLLRSGLWALPVAALMAAPATANGGNQQAGEPVPVLIAAPVAAPSFWEGPWIGLHLGMGSTNYDLGGSVTDGGGNTLGSLNLPDLGGQGPLVGLQVGYGFLLGPQIVAGVQLDYSYSSISNDSSLFIAADALGGGSPEIDATYSLAPRSMYGVSARLGYLPSDNTQIYGLVGYTRANFRGDLNLDLDGLTMFNDSYSFNLNGIALGIGMETRIGTNTSLGLEYRYTSLGRYSFFDDEIFGGPETAEVGFDTDVQTLRLTLNYHF